MSDVRPWVDDASAALVTDLYQLTMLQAYWHAGMTERAVFSLFFRRLPSDRNYMLACGQEEVLAYLERLHFDAEALEYLATLEQFTPAFLDWLAGFRFTGDVRAVPEGTPVFADEPILEVEAPIAEAQIAETFAMNQVHLQTVLASKAARMVTAAAGRPVVDFGLRRMHGTDAGLKGARAYHVAGLAATSNVLAGRIYGVPVTGTMAHSYIEAHDDEVAAFRDFASLYPGTVLLVDTYDTLEGVRRVIELAREAGADFRVGGIRLDSGDLHELSLGARRLLDEAGMNDVRILASGGLQEDKLADLVGRGAPIDGFGVGTNMGVSEDAPTLDLAYKLTEYAGKGRMKHSPGKETLPGAKQVFRMEEGGTAVRDVIARRFEEQPGRPLLEPLMRGGQRVSETSLEAARGRAADELARLPEGVRALAPADPPYPVVVSDELARERDAVAAWVARRHPDAE